MKDPVGAGSKPAQFANEGHSVGAGSKPARLNGDDIRAGLEPAPTDLSRNVNLGQSALPDTPGVYLFIGAEGDVLYIGKATSLRDRVKSYFNPDLIYMRGPKLVAMLALAKKIDYRETPSVLEALIQEAALIKKHHPPYNTRDKDDKSFNFVVVTDEDYPRVLIMRGRNLLKARGAIVDDDKKTSLSFLALYGPFPNGSALREAMKIVRRLFPFRDRCTPKSGKACFNAQIGLCSGVCDDRITKRSYRTLINRLMLFFDGKRDDLINALTQDMKVAAKALEFERAHEIKKTIFGLSHIRDVALIKEDDDAFLCSDSAESRVATPFRIEAYDIAHLSGTGIVGAMTVVTNGVCEPHAYKRFRLKTLSGADDPKALSEIVSRRLKHREWPLPSLIVVDGGVAQRNAIMRVLRNAEIEIPIVGVVKDDRHRPKNLIGPKIFRELHEKAILLANHESHRFALAYQKKIRRETSGMKTSPSPRPLSPK